MKVRILNLVENVAKVEITHYEQFLLLSQCNQNSPPVYALECICMWESIKIFLEMVDDFLMNSADSALAARINCHIVD